MGASPTVLGITPAQIPITVKLVLVISYPVDTTFNIWASYQYDTRIGANYTLAASKAEVVQADTRFKYFWDNINGHLYATVSVFKETAENFVSNGVTLYSLQWGSVIVVEATCVNAVGGFCPSTPYNLPGSIFA